MNMEVTSLFDSHFEKIISHFTQESHYEELTKAKNFYFQLTGKVNEDDHEYEARINCFLDWFVFHYMDTNGKRKIENYLELFPMGEDLALSFLTTSYSLFHYVKNNWSKKIVLQDILHNTKIVLNSAQKSNGIVEDDVFVGRIFTYKEQKILLRGLCIMPQDVLGELKKEAKKIRKLKNFNLETDFLLKLEGLKTKSMHYGHINPVKIFQFN